MHTHTGKALFKYALTAKNTFILALVMLAIGVAADLAGPFIARSMIDDHMLAIERPFTRHPGPAKKLFLMMDVTSSAETALPLKKPKARRFVFCRRARSSSSLTSLWQTQAGTAVFRMAC